MSAVGLLQIYRGIIDLTVTKFRDSDSLYIGIKETGYCILRSQLLMACHDKPQFRHLAMQVGLYREVVLLACLHVHDMPQFQHLAMQAGALEILTSCLPPCSLMQAGSGRRNHVCQ